MQPRGDVAHPFDEHAVAHQRPAAEDLPAFRHDVQHGWALAVLARQRNRDDSAVGSIEIGLEVENSPVHAALEEGFVPGDQRAEAELGAPAVANEDLGAGGLAGEVQHLDDQITAIGRETGYGVCSFFKPSPNTSSSSDQRSPTRWK